MAATSATVISVVESGTLEPERSIVENGGAGVFDPTHPGTNLAAGVVFGEDVLTFTDRTHQHNGAAFDATTNLLSAAGTNVVGLPSYLLGKEYVTFANDGRDNNPYNFQIMTDVTATFYLLLDNRADGTAGTFGSFRAPDFDG